MPEIRELLHDAAPTPRPYDEGAVRSRVAARRRRRAGVRVLGAAVAVAGLVGAYIGTRSEPEQAVVAEPPSAGAKVQGITSVAVADGEVWVAYEDGSIGREGGPATVELEEPIRSLHGEDSVLWALAADGETVVAVDLEGQVAHQWHGEALQDLEALGGGRAAMSSTDGGEIVIVEVGDGGLDEVDRIAVGPEPTNLVMATDGRLWVEETDSATICAVDPSTGEVLPVETFGGTLLAASDDGRIWVGTDRVVDLDPDLLEVGQSVAQGARYDYAGATMAVTAGDRLYVGGPAGLVQFAANDAMGLPVTADEPVSMAVDGDDLLYVAGGVVRRFDPERAALEEDRNRVREDAWRGSDPVAVAAQFVEDVLEWPEGELAGELDLANMTVELRHSHGVAAVHLEQRGEEWMAISLSTDALDGDDGTISFGPGTDVVALDFADRWLTPELLARYGDIETVRAGEVGGRATWEGELVDPDSMPGYVEVVWRDAAGYPKEAYARFLPPGPFSTG